MTESLENPVNFLLLFYKIYKNKRFLLVIGNGHQDHEGMPDILLLREEQKLIIESFFWWQKVWNIQ